MRIIIINPKKDFLAKQIQAIKKVGEVAFFEKSPSFSEKVFTDNEEKIIALGPEIVDWKFPNSIINKINNLKYVCLPTTGFGWLDAQTMKKNKIVLTNVPKYSTESVAEYAISLMLSVVKKLPLVIKNKWKIDYDNHQSWEVRGKIMGIVGLGTIGNRIAELGKSMGMKVIYWSRKSRNKKFIYKNLNTLLKTADFVFPCLARNDETNGLLNKIKLNLMKKGSFIVSITSEDIFDLKCAVSLLKKGRLSGIALESEKYTIKDFEGNVWVTPPIAWFTQEAFDEDMRIWTETIISCAKGKPINIVN